jgi:phage N-6-adenine-methyltransferase
MSKAVAVVTENAGLVDYEPKKGRMRILAAQAEAEMCRKAKDYEGLKRAVEILLSERRNFVLWWDGQEKSHARREMRALQTGDAQLALSDYGLDRTTIHRWRSDLKDEDKYQRSVEKTQDRCVKVCDIGKGQSDYARLTNTGEEEWYTPDRYLEAARAVLGGFDLDPASSARAQGRVRAGRFFTKEENGLEQEWRGRVWLNPPYSFPAVEHFARKLAEEYQAGRVTAAIMLTNNSTETEWFQAAAGVCASLCFPTPRIKFISSRTGEEDSSPLQGQAFFYFGEDVGRFFAEFSPFGFVVEVLENG